MKVEVVKKTQEKKPFEESWNRRSPEVQKQIYQRLSRALLPENYANMPVERGVALQFMRDNMKPKMNGKAHPIVESLMTC
jgi:hypothetical protein